MKLSRFIARRYLFAKKSHNVINIISIISAAGIAIGCAALVIILSVYNGFDGVVRDLNDAATADVLVTPVRGKVFVPDERFDAFREDPRVKAVNQVVLGRLVAMELGVRTTFLQPLTAWFPSRTR